MTTKRVFISYKREDRPRVKDLAENLEEVGLQVWYDKSIRVGDHWWDTILEQIEQCDVFVFAISQLALRSIPCQREREYAAALGKPFLLIQVGELTAIPNEYATIQFGDFRTDNPRVLTGLIGAINRTPLVPPALDLVPRPAAPIAPLDEIAATLDVEADLDFKDQLAILYRLKAAVDDPSTKTRALELIAVLLQKTLFVPIQTDCRAILDANTPAPVPPARPRPVLPLIGAVLVALVVLGISALIFAAANPPKATPTIGLLTTNTSLPVATTAVALLPATSIPASATTLPSKSPRPTETVTATLKSTLPPTPVPPTLSVGIEANRNVDIATPTSAPPTAETLLSIEQLAAQTDVAETATAVFNETQTATQWTRTPTVTFTPTITRTPTPDLNASLVAFRTQQTATVAAQKQANQTATATRWTRTPTSTFTPSATFTPSNTPTPTLIPAGATLTPTVYARTTIKDIPFVYVPRGCFQMGSDSNYDSEKPQHEVCLTQGFYIGEFEITNAQFTAYEKATGKNRASVTDSCKGASNADNQPVVCVAWTEADAYARWLGTSCQLPSEAQWEYAARSPANLIYPWGNQYEAGRANIDEVNSKIVGGKYLQKTSPVGSYPGGQSWIGAQDMAGNVWEWVNDWYGSSYYANRPKPDNNPTGPTSGSSRALRGGSWNFNSDIARAAFRSNFDPDYRNYNLGFRVVCSAPVA